ncbi:MAG: metallophosphoesterase, partial [Rikenellaceae bacterium]
FAIRDIFDDGILYYVCGCMKDRNYILFTIKPDTYDYEVVNF